MSKKNLTESEIHGQYIRPAIKNAGWKDAEIREEYRFTDGRMIKNPTFLYLGCNGGVVNWLCLTLALWLPVRRE